jgi:hypothetical protein
MIFTLPMWYQVDSVAGKGGFVLFSNGNGEYHPESDRATFTGSGIVCDVPGPGQVLEDFNTWSSQHESALYAEGQANLKERNRLLQEGVSKVEEMVDPAAPTDAKARADYKKLRQDMIDYEASETPAQFAARCAPQKEETPAEAFHRQKEEWAAAAEAKRDAEAAAQAERDKPRQDRIAQLERELGLKK